MNYLNYIEKIKAAACEILYDAKRHKIYKILYNGRHILVRLWSEVIDGKEIFHDGCQYQRHDENKSAVSITWTYISPEDFYNEFLVNEIQELRILQQRSYGQPKLKKPAACKNINLLGSVDFAFEKSVKCRVWRAGDVVYVLHRDWFSECISYDEAERRGVVSAS